MHESTKSDDACHQRFQQRRLFRRAIVTELTIHGSSNDVWARLSDFANYGTWNTFTTEVKGVPEVGTPIDITVHMIKRRPFLQREWVNLVQAPHTLCWGVHLGAPFLLTTNRWQTLRDGEEGYTTYRNELQLSGLLAPLVMMLYGTALARAFATAARCLKSACEL